MTIKRKIEQYTEDGKFVAAYLSLEQAAAANFRTIAAINHALTGRTKTCGGKATLGILGCSGSATLKLDGRSLQA